MAKGKDIVIKMTTDLNSNKSNWKLIDYINYWANKGNNDFKKLQTFINRHAELSLSTCVRLLVKEEINYSASIRSRTWSFNNEQEFLKLLALAGDFKQFDLRFDREFLYALRHCIDSGEYEHPTMVEKHGMCPEKLKVCRDKKQYVELLEEIYNFRNAKNLVNFRMNSKQRSAYKEKLAKGIVNETPTFSTRKIMVSTRKEWIKPFLYQALNHF